MDILFYIIVVILCRIIYKAVYNIKDTIAAMDEFRARQFDGKGANL